MSTLDFREDATITSDAVIRVDAISRTPSLCDYQRTWTKVVSGEQFGRRERNSVGIAPHICSIIRDGVDRLL
jgi:hypothetical protein